MHRGRRPDARREATRAHDRRCGRDLRGRRACARAGPRRAPSAAQPDRAGRARRRRVGLARARRRRDRQCRVLQAGRVFRRSRMAPRAGRRADPDQHDPRGREPAAHRRRDRGRAGVRVERDAWLCCRGYRVDCAAFRKWRTRHVPAVGHRRVGEELGADRAGERGLRCVSRRGLLHGDRHAGLARRADDARAPLRRWRRALVVPAVCRDPLDRVRAPRPARAADRALRRGDPRRGGAARLGARRLADPARGRRDRRGCAKRTRGRRRSRSDSARAVRAGYAPAPRCASRSCIDARSAGYSALYVANARA